MSIPTEKNTSVKVTEKLLYTINVTIIVSYFIIIIIIIIIVIIIIHYSLVLLCPGAVISSRDVLVL